MSDEYLASGFANVDEATDADAYRACLSLIDSLPFYQQQKRASYALLELGPGDVVLDAGCGLGEDVFRMAEIAGPRGNVIGIDSSAAMIERAKADARCKELAVEFHVGDLRNTSFPDGTFARCRIDRVLQHIPDAFAVVSELVRVLKPGGLLLAHDNDWGAFSISSGNKKVTRILEDIWCDSFPNGWIGRELRAHFVNAGLANVNVHPAVSLIEDFDTAAKVYNLCLTVQRAAANGAISAEEGHTWLDELRTRSQDGTFTAALSTYTVVGRKAQ